MQGVKITFGFMALVLLARAQPRVKSEQERDALSALQREQVPAQEVQKAENFILRFDDSEFKSTVFDIAASASESNGNSDKAISYAEEALSANQLDYQAMVLISGELARRIQDADPNKFEKLARAEKLGHEALATIREAPNPDAQHISDDRWRGLKKDLLAQAHNDLGLVAFVRGDMDSAVREFKFAVDETVTPDPGTMVRLAAAYNQVGKSEDASLVLNEVLALPGLNTAIRQFAEREQKRAQVKPNRRE